MYVHKREKPHPIHAPLLCEITVAPVLFKLHQCFAHLQRIATTAGSVQFVFFLHGNVEPGDLAEIFLEKIFFIPKTHQKFRIQKFKNQQQYSHLAGLAGDGLEE
jgi:hypothetical protein